jgi:predicted HTH transcriptional regulator
MSSPDLCALLDRLVAEPDESEWLEFKENKWDTQKIGEYVSALSNSAMLHDKPRAFIVWGVEDGTHKKVGTIIRLRKSEG